MGKAVGIIDEMLLAGISPNEHTYTTIMHGYASLGDTGKAFEYFSRVKTEGLELDVYTYEALLKACCKSGRMQSALAVTKEMKGQNIPRNTFIYNILIDGYELVFSYEYYALNHKVHFMLCSSLFYRCTSAYLRLLFYWYSLMF